MGALVGLGVGVGLLLIWSAFYLPRTPRPPRPGGTQERRQVLVRIHLDTVGDPVHLGPDLLVTRHG